MPMDGGIGVEQRVSTSEDYRRQIATRVVDQGTKWIRVSDRRAEGLKEDRLCADKDEVSSDGRSMAID